MLRDSKTSPHASPLLCTRMGVGGGCGEDVVVVDVTDGEVVDGGGAGGSDSEDGDVAGAVASGGLIVVGGGGIDGVVAGGVE